MGLRIGAVQRTLAGVAALDDVGVPRGNVGRRDSAVGRGPNRCFGRARERELRQTLEVSFRPSLPEVEGMSQVRKEVPIPFATNMRLVTFEQLAPGIHMRAVDIILGDVHFWGGFRENHRMIAVWDASQLAQVRHGLDSFRYFRDVDGAKPCRFNKSF